MDGLKQQPELKIKMVDVDKLIPYGNNARHHGDEDVDAIMASIKEFGFNDPIGVWRGIIVEGHGRLIAAKRLGINKVPVVTLDHLTDKERKAYTLAHNRTAELSHWNFGILEDELADLAGAIDMTQFNFKIDDIKSTEDWFKSRERYDNEDEDESDEYKRFKEKFDIKKTTDDCYTPDNVYEAVAEYVAETYGVKREQMVRPFYPGGDYQQYQYRENDVVVDNPPFSILSEILKFYQKKNIRFFLFAPTLVLFSSSSASSFVALVAGAQITYENGANVNTSFLTNLEEANIRAKTAPELYKRLKAANDDNLAKIKKQVPKYNYPDEVVTAPMLAYMSKYGIDFSFLKNESERISELEAQKQCGKAIYGSGYLVSYKAAAEKAAAEKAAAEKAAAEKKEQFVWELSEREKDIVQKLSNKKAGGQNEKERLEETNHGSV